MHIAIFYRPSYSVSLSVSEEMTSNQHNYLQIDPNNKKEAFQNLMLVWYNSQFTEAVVFRGCSQNYSNRSPVHVKRLHN
jgi:hypothetical protein